MFIYCVYFCVFNLHLQLFEGIKKHVLKIISLVTNTWVKIVCVLATASKSSGVFPCMRDRERKGNRQTVIQAQHNI